MNKYLIISAIAIVALVVTVGLFGHDTVTLQNGETSDQGGDGQAVELTEKKFTIIYSSLFGFTPGEIEVNQGDQVTIDFRSADGASNLIVDGYGFDMPIITAEGNETVRDSFTANQPGTFRIYNMIDGVTTAEAELIVR